MRWQMTRPLILLVCLALPVTSCGESPAPTAIPGVTVSVPTPTIQAVSSPIPTTVSATPQPISCDDWQSWPVAPMSVSNTVRAIYQRGQTDGNNAHAFSKIGDGEISTAWFLSAFDQGPEHYDLGPYQELMLTIEYFAGSFERTGMAARRGFNAQRILDTAVTLDRPCMPGESPLTCELRLHRPAFAIISLGTNQVWEPDEFEAGMRQILGVLVAKNVVPILSTKGDNLEGDHGINHRIACLAQEYDLPLWNFWAAIQALPDHGLQPDQEHLTYGITDFDNAKAMQTAWTVRNLTGLQVLDLLRKTVSR